MKIIGIAGLALLAGCTQMPTKAPMEVPERLTHGPWSVVPESLKSLPLDDSEKIQVWTFSNRMGQPCIVTYSDKPETASCGAAVPPEGTDEPKAPETQP